VDYLKVAIIGSGIGGCSAAYFLKELITEPVDITIFECNDKIGGRLLNRKIDPVVVELGGTFFHSMNLNMQYFVEKLSLQKEKFILPTIGVWNGSKFIYKSSSTALVTNLKLLLRYRRSALNLLSLLKRAKREILSVYANNRLDTHYTTCEALFESPFLLDCTRKTLEEVLKENGISSKLIKEIIEPGTRYIYHQNIDIDGFAGVATLIASDGSPIYKIKNGNDQLNKALLKSANANVKLNQRIVKINRIENKSFLLATQKGDSEEFDAVFIAAPLEQADIEFENLVIPDLEKREFRKVYIKLIEGQLNPEYFGMTKVSEIPELLLTTADFTGSFDNLETLGKSQAGHFVYDLFSPRPIPEDLVKKMFRECVIEENFHWEYAHPVPQPATQDFQPFLLAPRLFYINTMESVASTMETMTVAAKNAVLLLKKELEEG
jgi:prenylcysteine oxidase/farnesylcysteine lyase